MNLKDLALKYIDLGGRLVQLLNLPTLNNEQKKELERVDSEMQKIGAEMRGMTCIR